MNIDFAIIAERKIQEGIDEGAFTNLPGKGLPLVLDDLPPHMRLLKNAGIRPDWVQLNIQINCEREECGRYLHRISEEYARRIATDEEDKVSLAKWLERSKTRYIAIMRDINEDILRLNLVAPSILREQIPYRICEETARFEDAFPNPNYNA